MNLSSCVGRKPMEVQASKVCCPHLTGAVVSREHFSCPTDSESVSTNAAMFLLTTSPWNTKGVDSKLISEDPAGCDKSSVGCKTKQTEETNSSTRDAFRSVYTLKDYQRRAEVKVTVNGHKRGTRSPCGGTGYAAPKIYSVKIL